MTTSKQDLDRRRSILLRALGEKLQLKRDALKPGHPLRGRQGVLTDVRRTKCTLRYDDVGDWNVPIVFVWLPYSVEPLPGQRDLFAEGGSRDDN